MNHGTNKKSVETAELKPEQQKVLEEIYQYHDKGYFTDEDIALARIMFDKPEKFALLRKILGVLTDEERGLTLTSPQSLVQADIKDLHGYAIETAVNNLAVEKIKKALFSFYRLVHGSIVADKKAEFEEENQKEFDEEQRTEKHKEENPEGADLGVNL